MKKSFELHSKARLSAQAPFGFVENQVTKNYNFGEKVTYNFSEKLKHVTFLQKNHYMFPFARFAINHPVLGPRPLSLSPNMMPGEI